MATRELGRESDDWRNRATCADPAWDQNMWSSASAKTLGEAIWVCRNMCPVRAECFDWAHNNPTQVHDVIYGGVLWGWMEPKENQPAPRYPTALTPRRFQPEKREMLDNLDEVHDLVEDGVSYMDIAELFGVSTQAVKAFVTRHRNRPEWSSRENQ